MSRRSRYSAIAVAALLGVLAAYLLARSDSESQPGPRTLDQPESAEATPSTGPQQALPKGFDTAFRVAVPGSVATDWAPRVRYFIGGRAVRVIDADEARDGNAWTGCPEKTEQYAERDCPVSMNDTIEFAAREGELVAEPGAPTTVGCDQVGRLPAFGGRRVASLRPDAEHRNCFADFAITLYVNARNQVEAVNFVLSSP